MRPLGLLALALAVGCAGNGGASGGGWPCPSDGVVLLSWSIRKQPPTADQGCAGIDHLVAELDSPCAQVEIEPIPCINGDRWRYDTLPAAMTSVTLLALDARSHVVAHGGAVVTLVGQPPAQPTPIDLE
jgi:hypothetical protein